MKVIQLISSISYGDGVSNDCLAIRDMLQKSGYKTEIYSEAIDPRLKKEGIYFIRDLPELNHDDVLIYHLSIGTELNYKIAGLNGKKIIRYHNITPPSFFVGYNSGLYQGCKKGLIEAAFLSQKIHHVMADSQFNKNDLIKLGYLEENIKVFPILIRFEDYANTHNKSIISKYSDGKPNLVFVGRIVPNKRQHEVIKAFYYYKKYYNSDARLFLVGSVAEELYMGQLKRYVEALDLNDVYFTGHIKFDQILSYYHLADAFVCMSEHEGFCIPVVEAMYFKTPVIAWNTSAVGETLGGTGILLEEKDCLLAAGMIDRVVKDPDLKQYVVDEQCKRLKDFSREKVEEDMLAYIKGIICEGAV